MRDSTRRATAFHEAGHAVAAWRLGFKVTGASIVPSDEAAGWAKYLNPLRGIRLDLEISDRVRLRSEKRIVVLLAGPEAQRHYAPRPWRSCHGSHDDCLAADLASNLNEGHVDATNAYLKWLEIRTRHLINQLWWAVENVAHDLHANGELSGEEVVRLITKP